jgi:AhpD family alkylhydroperoxidase
MENQLEHYDEVVNCLDKYEQAVPGVRAARTTYSDEVFRDGALSNKVKGLLALAIALRSGCTECVIGQTKNAVNWGATKAEITEAVSVAAIMGGITASSQRWRVFKVLEELGKW